MTLLILLSLFIITAYVVVMIIKEKKVPYSISATYYSLKHKFWFGFTMIASAAFLLPVILEYTPDKYRFVAFLAIVGMILVGVSPNFKDKSEKTLHTVGAVMSLVFSQIWVACINPWFLFILGTYLIYTIIALACNWSGRFGKDFIKTKPMFWVEITALISPFIILLIA